MLTYSNIFIGDSTFLTFITLGQFLKKFHHAKFEKMVFTIDFNGNLSLGCDYSLIVW